MISAKEAVVIAKRVATEMLGADTYSLEEIERDTYQNRDAWSITLGKQRSAPRYSIHNGIDDKEYKKFLIDVESGEMIAMKIRELAA